MTEVEVFKFPATGQQIRVVDRSGEPWFLARDVCGALTISNVQDAVSGLDEDERSFGAIEGTDIADHAISEAGLYSLILRSRKPEARAFKRWVTHDVLPAIRKSGSYELARRVPQSFAEALELAAKQAREIEAKSAALAIAAPKADYVDHFVKGDEAALLRVVAAQLGVGERVLRDYLIHHKVIYRRPLGSRWSESKQRLVTEYSYHPYAERKAWFRTGDQPEAPRGHNEQMKTTLYVTPVGKVGIQNLLARHPIGGAK